MLLFNYMGTSAGKLVTKSRKSSKYLTATGKTWKPTEAQRKYLEVTADPNTPTELTKVADIVGVNRGTIYGWMRTDAFMDWYATEWQAKMSRAIPYLDKIGLKKAEKDFRYWEAMQIKYGGYSRVSDSTGNVNVFIKNDYLPKD